MTIAFSKDTVLIVSHFNLPDILMELERRADEPLEIEDYYASDLPGYSDIYLGALLFSRGIPTEWFTVFEKRDNLFFTTDKNPVT